MIADNEYVQLAHAHVLVGVARATLYRWHAEDRIEAIEKGKLGKGMKLYVRAGDVRELAARMYKLRHSAATVDIR